jgi:hypothetical protein
MPPDADSIGMSDEGRQISGGSRGAPRAAMATRRQALGAIPQCNGLAR